jgi:hypothetical protein
VQQLLLDANDTGQIIRITGGKPMGVLICEP